MAIPSLQRTLPSVTVPGLITPVFQAVNFKKGVSSVLHLGGIETPKVYINQLEYTNTSATVSQTWNTHVDRAELTLNQLSCPVYSIDSRISYTVQDEAKFQSLTGRSLLNTYRAIVEQGVANKLHLLTFYGANVKLKQGFLSQATMTALPADAGGNTKMSTYDKAELLDFLLHIIQEMQNATYGAVYPSVIYAPTKAVVYLQQTLVPFLNSANAGSLNSIFGTVNFAVDNAGMRKIEIIKDDTLRGKGTNGKDVMLFICTQIDPPVAPSDINENGLYDKENKMFHNTLLVMPVQHMTTQNPSRDFTMEEVIKTLTTSGWLLRPEACYSVEYEF